MTLKFANASFTFMDGDKMIVVAFEGDEVKVYSPNRRDPKRIPNKPAKWGGRPLKPRVTDAMKAIHAAAPKRKVDPKALGVFGR
jgi:hypothetical protein